MKKLIKQFSVFVAIIATIFTLTPVKAEVTNPGVITIKSTTKDKQYDIFKIFDLTYRDITTGETTTKKVAYTIDSTWNNFFGSSATGSKYILNDQPSGENLNMIIIGDDTKYINITESNVAEFAQDALAYVLSNTISPDKSVNGTGSDLVVDDLELGYYLVYPKGATTILSGNSSICSLTSTTPEATVNVKSTYPEITKDVNDNFVEVGQVVTFEINGLVPNTKGYSSYTYKITDTMTSGLSFDLSGSEFTVKFGDTTISPSATELVQNGNGFILNFDMTNYQAYKGQEITITYNATVTKDAILNVTTNSAVLEYSNTPTSTITNDPIQEKLYSSRITIDKFESGNETLKLSGAKFVLVKTIDNVDYYYQAFSSLTSTEQMTEVSTTSDTVVKVDWTTDKNAATVLVTDTNGYAEFGGIEAGSYQLEETEAPTGYNKLTSRVDVVVSSTKEIEGEEETVIVDASVNAIAKVANDSGTQLPETGGLGTKILIALGLIVALFASVILVTNKRMAKEQF